MNQQLYWQIGLSQWHGMRLAPQEFFLLPFVQLKSATRFLCILLYSFACFTCTENAPCSCLDAGRQETSRTVQLSWRLWRLFQSKLPLRWQDLNFLSSEVLIARPRLQSILSSIRPVFLLSAISEPFSGAAPFVRRRLFVLTRPGGRRDSMCVWLTSYML